MPCVSAVGTRVGLAVPRCQSAVASAQQPSGCQTRCCRAGAAASFCLDALSTTKAVLVDTLLRRLSTNKHSSAWLWALLYACKGTQGTRLATGFNCDA